MLDAAGRWCGASGLSVSRREYRNSGTPPYWSGMGGERTKRREERGGRKKKREENRA